MPPNEPWHACPWGKVLEALRSSTEGLSEKEAAERLAEVGPNELRQQKRTSVFIIFFRQFNNILIYLLLAAMAISFLLGEIFDVEIIGIIVLLNALLGTYQEVQAERSIESLRKILVREAYVLRGGKKRKLPAANLVPGDIIEVDAGDYVPADARVMSSSGLTVDESALTGESEPAAKTSEPVPPETPVGDRDSMLFAGTVATAGRCRAVVTDTGMRTEIGKIAGLVEAGVKRETPVQISIDRLGKIFGLAAVGICILIFGVGVLEGQRLFDMFLVAVSLAVAAIPEGLPATVTIIFALGVRRMAKRNAIVRKLSAVETLGSTSVICTDKTGTLTQNLITVRRMVTASGEFEASQGQHGKGHFQSKEGTASPSGSAELKTLLTAGVLCNNATYEHSDGETRSLGDSTEVALLIAGDRFGLSRATLDQECPRELEIPFSSDTMFMLTAHKCPSGIVVYAKGAPERILDRCTHLLTDRGTVALTGEARERFLAANRAMAEAGMRVLGFSYKPVKDLESEKLNLIESEQIFIGLSGMIDPPRPEVKQSIARCQKSGITVVMITGDQLLTAVSIARELGIFAGGDEAITGIELAAMTDEELFRRASKIRVYARTSPEQKLRIVKALQKHDLVVAMTGDGVNDAPALKSSDIGVSMGLGGTEVARQASDIVLADDNFSTIERAVEEGRTIYANLRKTVMFLFSSNLGEVLTITLGLLLGLPLPLLAVQILWVNLITDSFPAMALGVDTPDHNVMEKPPRPRAEGIITKSMAIDLVILGIVIALGTMGMFYLYLDRGVEYARTMAFTTLIVIEMWNVLNCKAAGAPILRKETFNNYYLLATILLSIALLLFVVYIPALQAAFGTVALSGGDLAVVVIATLVIAAGVEIVKVLKTL